MDTRALRIRQEAMFFPTFAEYFVKVGDRREKMFLQSPRLVWFVYAATLVVAAMAVATMPWWTVDDAYISYRYGYNLLHHGQLTWNAGQSPLVEGYTGILLPLLAAGILALGLPLVLTIKILGVVATLGLFWIVNKFLQSCGVERLGRSLASFGLAANPLLYMHSISGLETIFFTFFVTASILQFGMMGKAGAGIKEARLSALFLLFAGLCRPEGIGLAMLMFGWLLVDAIKEKFKPGNGGRILWIGGATSLLLAFWIWRSIYYGNLLPNSFYAKSFDGWINWESAMALGKFIGYYCFLPAVGCLAASLGFRAQKKTLFRPAVLVSVLFAGICCLTYLHSHLWMNYGSRFFFPFLPLIVVGVTSFFSSNWQDRMASQTHKGGLAKTIRYVFIILALLQTGILGFRFRQEWAFLHYYDAIVEDELVPAGELLEASLPRDATVISYMDAGALGYYSKLNIIDFGRLSDAYLAQSKPSQEQVLDYFFSLEADALVMTSQAEFEFDYTDEAEAIVSDPRFDAFTLKQQWGNHVGYPYWQRLYLKRQ